MHHHEIYFLASRFSLRWFTTTIEEALCGHATLASSHVLFNEIGNTNDEIYFETLSGELIVQKSTTQDGVVSMNFPQFTEMYDIELSNKQSFGTKFPALENPRHFVELANEIGPYKKLTYAPTLQELIMVLDSKMTRKDFIEINPSIDKLLEIQPINGNGERSAIILTLAPENPTKQGFVDSHGKPYDYASRYITPWSGVDEDPATGSSQCTLAPFWAQMLNKNGPFYAYQGYPTRGAEFYLELLPEKRMNITGKAFTFMKGTIQL
uniref:Uncharacterized protein n=1 Tax=Acrobeloides nanus TaxID=290746 RepID=A0A914ESF6_9BILA